MCVVLLWFCHYCCCSCLWSWLPVIYLWSGAPLEPPLCITPSHLIRKAIEWVNISVYCFTDKETGSCISWNSSPILTQLANDRNRILTKAWFLNHCYIAFSVPSVMWTLSLSMVFIIFSYSEDLEVPVFWEESSFKLWAPLVSLFLSTWGLGWGEEETGLPVTCHIHPYFEVLAHSCSAPLDCFLLSLI